MVIFTVKRPYVCHVRTLRVWGHSAAIITRDVERTSYVQLSGEHNGVRAARRWRGYTLLVVVLTCALAACGTTAKTSGKTQAPAKTATPTVLPSKLPHGWSVVDSPAVAPEGRLVAVTALSGGDAWAVGQYEGTDALQRTLTEHWDGTRWKFVPSANPDSHFNLLSAVAEVSFGDAWAVGETLGTDAVAHPLIEHWNGSAWSVSASPDVGKASVALSGVAAVTANDVWAVGTATTQNPNSGPTSQPLLLHWNGSAWQTVSSPAIPATRYGAPSGRLNAITALASNDVWAVGANNEPSLIEHWDGSQWRIIPGASTADGELSELASISAVSARDIWAVGGGPLGGGQGGCGAATATVIEHWDGSSWSKVPFPTPSTNVYGFSFASVAASAANDVWAVGGQYAYGSGSATAITPVIEHWNGSAWNIVDQPNGVTSAGLTGVASREGTVWAVGQHESVNGAGATLVEQLVGAAWSLVDSPSPGTVANALYGISAVSPSDAWAVGDSGAGTLAEHWNGSAWMVYPSPNATRTSNTLAAVAAPSSSDVWAVGSAGAGNGLYTGLIDHWNGTQWATVPGAKATQPALNGVAALSPNNAWAVGDGSYIEHWDGTKWSEVAHPAATQAMQVDQMSLFSIAAVSASDIYAVGGIAPHNCGGLMPALIEHWDGKAWTAIPNTPQGVLFSVSADAANDVWAVGLSLIMHWDGKTWSTVPNTAVGGQARPLLKAVAARSASDVWVGGDSYPGALPLVEHWDGKTWSLATVPGPGRARNEVFGVTALPNGEVWAVGSYAQLKWGGAGATQALIVHYEP